MSEWISVGERLPKTGVPVLVTYRNAIDGKMQGDGVATQLFGEGRWYWWEGSEEDCDTEVSVEITHWMPLPEPPVAVAENATTTATNAKTETVRCADCNHLMFSDCYGECGAGHRGIVRPDDTCPHGERRGDDD